MQSSLGGWYQPGEDNLSTKKKEKRRKKKMKNPLNEIQEYEKKVKKINLNLQLAPND